MIDKNAQQGDLRIFFGPLTIKGTASSKTRRSRRNRGGTYYSIDHLVPHLGLLRKNLLTEHKADKISEQQYRSLELEMLPYSLMACQAALYDSVSAQEQLLKSSQSRDGRVQLSVEQWQALAYPVDAFLERADRCHNALTHYLPGLDKRSRTRELAKVVQQVKSNKVDFGEAINALIIDYWQKNGGRLARYRNVSQHCAVVSSDAQIFVDKAGAALRFTLPTNPEVKVLRKLDYENSHVQALRYMSESFGLLLELIYHVTRKLSERFPVSDKSENTVTQILWPTMNRAPVILGEGVRIDGHLLISHKRMARGLRLRMKRNRDVYDRLLGPKVIEGKLRGRSRRKTRRT